MWNNIRCAFGIHRWTKWVTVEGTRVLYSSTTVSVTLQQRECTHCGIKNITSLEN
jgi:hypothetical protein